MTAAWPRVSLGELITLDRRPVNVMTDKAYQEIGLYSYGRGIFHKTPRSGLEVGDKSLFEMRSGDLVFQITFAWEGAIALCSDAEEGLFGSVRYPTYRVDESRCFPPFLRRYLCAHEGLDQIGRICPGSAGRNRVLALKRLPEVQVPLPPIDEQWLIENKIEAQAVRITEAQRLRRDAEANASSYTWAICEKYFKAIGSRYQVRVLEELVDQNRGISYGIVQTGREVEGGVPTLRAGDLQWFGVRTTGIKKVDPHIEKSFQRTRLRGNELLLRIRGGVGELAVSPPELIGGNVSREIAVIPLDPLVDPTFAMYMLAAPTNQTLMHGQVRGTSYIGINLKDVRRIAVPVPPIAEQQRIVAEIREHHSAIEFGVATAGGDAIAIGCVAAVNR